MKNISLLFLVILMMFPFIVYCQSNDNAGEGGILERRINCKYTNVPLKDILADLAEHQGIYFNYIDEEIPLDKRITLDLVAQPINIVLKTIFSEINIAYFLIGSQIVLQHDDLKKEDLTPVYASSERINEDIFKKRDTLKIFPKNKDVLPEANNANGKEDDKLKEETEVRKVPVLNTGIEKLSLGIVFTPEYAVQSIKTNKAEGFNSKSVNYKSNPTASFGLSLNYFFKKNWFIRSGLLYQTFGEKGKLTVSTEHLSPHVTNTPSDPFPNSNPGNSTTYPNPIPGPQFPYPPVIDHPDRLPQDGTGMSNAPGRSVQSKTPDNSHPSSSMKYSGMPFAKSYKDTTISYSNVYSYFSLPVGIGYRLGNKKFLNVVSGVLVNYYAGSEYKWSAEISEAKTILKEHNYKRITGTFFCSLETGFRYKRLTFSIAPSFKYFLSSIYLPSENVANKPYSWGLSLGANYIITRRD